MNTLPLRILASSFEEPKGYTDRLTVKAVVLNEVGRILLFGGSLLGGGVEKDEDLEWALKRECLEEAGVLIDSLKPIGIVIQYRDALKKRYEIHGFLTRFIEKISEPTTASESEKKRTVTWLTLLEAKESLQNKINEIEKIGNQDPASDKYQAELFNTMTSLVFLQEIEK